MVLHVAKVDERVVQAQGGWSTLETMRSFYTRLSSVDVQRRLLGTVGSMRSLPADDEDSDACSLVAQPAAKRTRASDEIPWDAAPWCKAAPLAPSK